MEISERLDYHPNILARGLVIKRTSLLGLVVRESCGGKVQNGGSMI